MKPERLLLRRRFDARLRPLHLGQRRGGIEVHVRLLEQFLRPLERRSRALHVDLFGAFAQVRQHPHVVRQHFDEAAVDREIARFACP